MRRLAYMVLGFALFLGSLWGGGWLLGQLPHSAWQSTPTLLTSILVALVGLCFVLRWL